VADLSLPVLAPVQLWPSSATAGKYRERGSRGEWLRVFALGQNPERTRRLLLSRTGIEQVPNTIPPRSTGYRYSSLERSRRRSLYPWRFVSDRPRLVFHAHTRDRQPRTDSYAQTVKNQTRPLLLIPRVLPIPTDDSNSRLKYARIRRRKKRLSEKSYNSPPSSLAHILQAPSERGSFTFGPVSRI